MAGKLAEAYEGFALARALITSDCFSLSKEPLCSNTGSPTMWREGEFGEPGELGDDDCIEKNVCMYTTTPYICT